MTVDVTPKPSFPPTYLGDGVYASYDGYHFNLTLGDHRNQTMIALDPRVMDSLKNYEKHINDLIKDQIDRETRKPGGPKIDHGGASTKTTAS